MIGQIKCQPEDFIVQEIAMVQGQIQKANDDNNDDIDANNVVDRTQLLPNNTDHKVVVVCTTNVLPRTTNEMKFHPPDMNVPKQSPKTPELQHPPLPVPPPTNCGDIVPASTFVAWTTTSSSLLLSSSSTDPPPRTNITGKNPTNNRSVELKQVVNPLQCLESLFQNHLHSFIQIYKTENDINHSVTDSINENDNVIAPSRQFSTEKLRSLLQDLEETALQRIQDIHVQYQYSTDTNNRETTPPTGLLSSTTSYPNDNSTVVQVTLSYHPQQSIHHKDDDDDSTTATELQYKQHKTNLHEWFRRVYPLLIAESCKNTIDNGNHRNSANKGSVDTTNQYSTTTTCTNCCYYYYTIRIRIDTAFDGLIPYLYAPIEDLPSLYRYAKHGYDVTKCNKRHYLGRNVGPTKQSGLYPILRLLPNLPRPYRRPLHQLVDQKSNSLLGTETLTDYPLTPVPSMQDDTNGTPTNTLPLSSTPAIPTTATTTTAIRISWTKMAARKASKKRQREEVSDAVVGASPTATGRTLPKMSKMLCVVKKRQREHLGMIHTISAVLKCAPSEIGFAGMKDLQAITYQFGTLNDHVVQRYQQNSSLKDILFQRGIEIIPLHPVPEPLNKGDLIGNYFEIIVRNVRRVQLEYNPSKTDAIISPIQETFVPVDDQYVQDMIDRVRRNGFINFYGEQRVGDPGHMSIVGVRAFDIGRAMLQQNYSKAIDLLMTGRRMINGIDLVEKNDVEPFRRVWKETNGNAVATSKALPSGSHSVPRERAVVKGLVRYGTDQPLAAFRCLQRNERLFFINAVCLYSPF